MILQEAAATATRLWHKWVTTANSDVDLDRIGEAMSRELAYFETGHSPMSAGLARELRGERVLLGRVRGAYRAAGLAPPGAGSQEVSPL